MNTARVHRGVHTPPRPKRPTWLRPLRRTVLVFVVVIVVEYVVAPSLVGASKDLGLLARLQPGWLITGIGCEAAALVAYALLVRALLPRGQMRFGRLIRIVLATTAVGHVVPGGGAGSAGMGYRLLTLSGVDGTTAGFTLATAALGSAVVLNVLLWLSLLDEALYLLDADGQIVIGTHLDPIKDSAVTGHFDLTDVETTRLIGSVPKGIALSGLQVLQTPRGWRCTATVDV